MGTTRESSNSRGPIIMRYYSTITNTKHSSQDFIFSIYKNNYYLSNNYSVTKL